MHDAPDTVRLDPGWRERRTADMERRRERIATTIAGIVIVWLSLVLYALVVR
jgi:hypothetical protein